MRPYSPGKPIDEVKRELGLTEVVKLASNENPLGPSPMAIEAVRKAAAEMHIYPDASGFAVKEALSGHFGCPSNQILLGNGSDELIRYLGDILLSGSDTELIMGDPSFVRYESAAELAGAGLVKVPLTRDLRHDVDAMADAFSPRTRLVYIANPNNPTGTVVTRAEVDRLLARLPSGAVLVLDEAYYEFGAHLGEYPDSLNYVKAGAPVVGLRTFSKAYGLAGIRLGYGFASREIADAIDRAREPFNVNSLAQAAAIAALGDPEHVRKTVAENGRGLAAIAAACDQLGYLTIPSYANFVLIDLGRPAEPVFQALLREGVIVRSGHVLGLPTYLRVSVGSAAEVATFITALQKVSA
jgi:histidinol-phosphate aminotransferase